MILCSVNSASVDRCYGSVDRHRNSRRWSFGCSLWRSTATVYRSTGTVVNLWKIIISCTLIRFWQTQTFWKEFQEFYHFDEDHETRLCWFDRLKCTRSHLCSFSFSEYRLFCKMHNFSHAYLIIVKFCRVLDDLWYFVFHEGSFIKLWRFNIGSLTASMHDRTDLCFCHSQ